MKLTISLVLGLVITVVAVMQMVRADHLESRLKEVEQSAKEERTACTHLAGEIRSAIRLPDDNEMKVKDDGTVVILHKPSATRWEFSPNSSQFRVFSPTR